MQQTLKLLILMAVVTLTIGCAGCADTKDGVAGNAGNSDFEQTMRVADSLYNGMQFRDAYDLYVQLLDSKEAEADSEKKLRVLNSLSNASELSGHKADMQNVSDEFLDQVIIDVGKGNYHSVDIQSPEA